MSWNQEIQLYRKLLHILEEESQVLARADEAALLKLARAKEDILQRLLSLPPPGEGGGRDGGASRTAVTRLKGKVAAANRRNQELISASLEVIQDFLAQLSPPGPGTYRPAGQLATSTVQAHFSRQV